MTKHKLKTALLAVLLLLPVGLRAQQTLTVCDSTATSSYVPMYGYYNDSRFHNEFVYPARMLTDMVGGTITEITFYSQTASESWNSPLTLTIDEVDDTTYDSYNAPFKATDNAQLSWSGSCTVTNGQWVITLDDPYVYTGGNLLISVRNTATGSGCPYSYFFGVSTGSINYAGYRNGGSDFDLLTITSRLTFLPKATFSYTAGGGAICYRPRNIVATAIDSTEATILWSDVADSYVYEWDNTPFTPGTGLHNAGTTTDTSLYLSGLMPSTVYYVYLRSNCAGGDTSSWVSFSFRTACGIVSSSAMPFAEDFTNWTTGSSYFDPCWTKINTGSRYPEYPYASTNTNPAGTSSDKCLYFYPDNVGGQYAVMPRMENLSGMMVSFYAKGSSNGTLGVGLMSDPSDTSTYTQKLTVASIPSSSNWTYYEVQFGDNVEQQYIAFRGTVNNSYGYSIYVDDIMVKAAPNCPRPTTIAMRNIMPTSAELFVADSNEYPEYIVELFSGNTRLDSVVINDSVNTYSTLTANTEYMVRVTPLCSDGNFHTPLTTLFRTPCTGIEHDSLPWTEDFESYPAASYASTSSVFNNSCWNILDRYSSSYPYVTNSSSYVHNGSQALVLYGTSTTHDVVVLPYFVDPVANLMLSFWTSTSNTSAYVELGVVSNPNDASTFVPVQECRPTATSLYQQFESTFSGLNGYIALRYNGSYNNVYIDDITVQEVPSCVRPSGATVSDVTTTSATVTILDPNETGHYYMVIGTDSTEVFGSEAYLTDLLPGQFYNLRLYTVCDDTLLGPTAFSFSTSLEATTLPYTTGFEVDEDSLWTLVNGTNAWTLGSAAHSSGSRSLYISNDGSANAYSTGTACFSYAIRAFQIDEAGSYAYSFDWLGDGESSYDYLRAWFAPGTSLPTANAAPDGVSSSYNFSSMTPAGWVDLGNGLMNDATTWQTKSGDFNIATPGTYYMIFMWANDGGAGNQPAGAIDNVQLMALSCNRPTNLALDTVTENSILFHWTGDASSYDVSINGEHFTTSDTFYLAENLTSNTAYSVAVSAICGGDLSMSATATFRTACGAIATLPWTENFDSFGEYFTNYASAMVGTKPVCFDFIAQSSSAYMSLSDNSYRYGTSGYSLFFYPGTTYAKNILVLPTFADDISGMELSFQTRPEGTSAYTGSLQVGYITDVTDSTTFVVVESYDYSDFNNAYESRNVTFANAPSGARMAFRHSAGNASNYYWFIDELDVHEAPLCQRPVAVSVTDVDTATAVMHINDPAENGSYRYVLSHTDANGTVNDTLYTTDTVTTLTGLQHSSPYTLTVAAVCSDMSVTSSVSTSFTTECAPEAIPFAFTPAQMLAVQASGFTTCWSFSSFYRNSNNGVGYVYSYTNGGTFQLPALDVESTDFANLQFRTHVATTYANNTFRVGVNEGTGIVWLDTIALEQNATYTSGTEYVIPLTSYFGNGNQVVVGTLTTNSVYFLDFYVEPLDDCAMVSDIVMSNIDADEATLSWVSNGTESEWMVVVNGTDTLTATTNPYTLTGLSANTAYNVSVSALCAAGDTSRMVSVNFRTPCVAIETLPWTENFDSYPSDSYASATSRFDDPCWTILNRYTGYGSTSNYPYIYNSSSYAHSGTNSLNFYGSSNPATVMALPKFADSLSTLMFSFWMNAYSTYAVEVGYMPNPSDANSFVAVQTVHPTTSYSYEYHEVLFPAAANGHIALRYAYSYSGSSIYLDDFTVDHVPSCARPSSVEVTDITANSATVTVADPNNANHYRLILVSGGVQVDSVDITSNTYTYTALAPSSSFSLSVSTLCDDGTATMPVSTNFSTPCVPVTVLPWSEDFDAIPAGYNRLYTDTSSYLNCWNLYTGAYDSASNTATLTPATFDVFAAVNYATAFDSSMHLRVNIYGDNVHRWLVTPSIVLGTGSTLSFNYALTQYNSNNAITEAGDDDRFLVLVTTNGGATWTPVKTWGHGSGYDFEYRNASSTGDSVSIDLSAYNGQTVRIAFFGSSTVSGGDNDFHIDNIAITADSNAPQPEMYTVSAASADAVMGSATVSATRVAAGTSVTATATANSGYHFTNWTAAGTVVSTANPYTFTVSADIALTANFEADGTEPEECVDPTDVAASDVTSTSATISWMAGGSETRWAIDWGTGADTTANNPYTLTGLEPNTTYYVKVKALCADGNESGWSSPATFTTATVGIDDVDAAAISLYPNPATTTVTISGISGQATVTVVDMNGRVSGEWRVENGEITLDLTGYAQGAYFVRIVGEQQSAVRKLIVK